MNRRDILLWFGEAGQHRISYRHRLPAREVTPFTLKVDGTVNQGCSLKFMHVIVFFFRKIFDEVNMLAIAHIDGTTCFPTELVKMFIGKVSVKLHFVKMVFFVFHIDCFPGYRTESVIMALVSLIKYSGTAGYKREV